MRVTWRASDAYRRNILTLDVVEGSIAADGHDGARAISEAREATHGRVLHVEVPAGVAVHAGALIEASRQEARREEASRRKEGGSRHEVERLT